MERKAKGGKRGGESKGKRGWGGKGERKGRGRVASWLLGG